MNPVAATGKTRSVRRAMATTTQCPYYVEIHTANARKAGATDAELVEAGIVAAALRAGGAITHTINTLAK